jgi:membrane associated rhomboid family serine protease
VTIKQFAGLKQTSKSKVIVQLGEHKFTNIIGQSCELNFDSRAYSNDNERTLHFQCEQEGFMWNSFQGECKLLLSTTLVAELQHTQRVPKSYDVTNRKGVKVGSILVVFDFGGAESKRLSIFDRNMWVLQVKPNCAIRLLTKMPEDRQLRGFLLEIDSPLIFLFTLVCFLIRIVGYFVKDFDVNYFACYPYKFMYVRNPLTYWRLVSHVLGHSSWGHFYNNMTLLLLVGPNNERNYGAGSLGKLVVLAALITGLAHVLFETGNGALLGASGIVFMNILLNSFVNFHRGLVPMSLLLTASFWLTREVHNSAKDDSVSQLAHIVGGLCGAGLGYILNEYRSFENWWLAVRNAGEQAKQERSKPKAA